MGDEEHQFPFVVVAGHHQRWCLRVRLRVPTEDDHGVARVDLAPHAGPGVLDLLLVERSLVGKDVLYELASAIAERQQGRALDIAASITATAADCNLVSKQLSDIFRNVQMSGSKAASLYVSDDEREIISKIAKSIPATRAASFVDEFAKFNYAVSVNLKSQWVLESLVAKLSA